MIQSARKSKAREYANEGVELFPPAFDPEDQDLDFSAPARDASEDERGEPSVSMTRLVAQSEVAEVPPYIRSFLGATLGAVLGALLAGTPSAAVCGVIGLALGSLVGRSPQMT